jgi:spore coat protein CotH
LLAVLLAVGLLVFNRTWGEGPASGEDTRTPFAFLFDSQLLPIFELTLPESSVRNLAADPFVYQPADFTYRSPSDARDTIVLPSVGVRLKGLGSFRPIGGKPALKIRFDKYLRRQHFFGLRRLTLNNMKQDPSMVRERLAYHFFRKAGLVAPLCNSARLFVNGAYYGLYANVQTIDRIFVQTHFDPAPGNLYDLSTETYGIDLEPRWKQFFVLETNRALNDTSDLDELIRTIDGPHESFVSAAESVVDLDQWLAVGAAQAIIAGWDSYFGGPNNYKLYHELGCDRFLLFPWGVDQTFGILNGRFKYMRYPIDGSRSNGRLFRRCTTSPECYGRYLAHVESKLQLWESSDLPAELDRIFRQIRPSVFEDKRRGYPYEEFERAVEEVRRFLLRRGHIVRLQLAREQAGQGHLARRQAAEAPGRALGHIE